MNLKYKLIILIFFLILPLFLAKSSVLASEGTVELTGRSDARCFASSVYMQNGQFKVLVSCQNLNYPPTPTKFAYVLWAVPLDGGNPQKLGGLGLGKVELVSRAAFQELFVTAEVNDKVRKPSSDLIMQGRVRDISLLDNGELITLEPSPTPETLEPQGPAEDFGEILEKDKPPAPEEQESNGILGFLRKGGVILAAVVFIILLILAFLTRARG